MGWKKFPSQGLTSLANTPTLTSVWVPRWWVWPTSGEVWLIFDALFKLQLNRVIKNMLILNWLLQWSDFHLSDYITCCELHDQMNFAYNKTKSPICLSTTENLPSIFTRQRDFIIEVKVIYDLYYVAYNTFVMYRIFPTNYSILLFVLCLKNNFFLLNMFVFLCCQGRPVW